MIARLIFLLLALIVLGVLLYMQQPETGGPESTSAAAGSVEPGFVAVGAQVIETGDNGQPLYRLDAARIAQPVPEGLIYLTDPIMHYTPPGANPWVLTAQRGQLPQSAHTADLSGEVHADGKPSGSLRVMDITTDTLHVDIQQQIATTPAMVHLRWAGSLLNGRGLRANMKSGEFELMEDVSGNLRR